MERDEIGEPCSTHGIDERYKFFVRNLNRRDHFKDVRIDVRIILKRILHKEDMRTLTEFFWLRSMIGTTGRCEEGELLGSIKGGRFCDQSSNYQRFMNTV